MPVVHQHLERQNAETDDNAGFSKPPESMLQSDQKHQEDKHAFRHCRVEVTIAQFTLSVPPNFIAAPQFQEGYLLVLSRVNPQWEKRPYLDPMLAHFSIERLSKYMNCAFHGRL